MEKDKTSKSIDKIINKYDLAEDFLISTAYGDGGSDNPFPRLDRAAINQQSSEHGATLSRYAIWANTVRDNIVKAVDLLKDNPQESVNLLMRSCNSLSAFSDIQALFDPLEHGKINSEPLKLKLIF
ncbi:MAG: hypothetical protein RBR08_16235 [Desulforegulaceae bacterium]|nr:hypothetical protein [Desulforegulaceae bacterium]